MPASSTSPATLGSESLREQNSFLAALHQITLDLLNRRSLDDLLHAIVNTAADILRAPYVEITVREGDYLVVRASTSNLPDMSKERVGRDEARLTWKACDSGQPVVIDDYATWEYRRRVYDSFHVHAVAAIPILISGSCFGVLDISRTDPGAIFTPEEIQKALLFSQMIALVLENARLYQTALKEIEQRKQADQALLTSEQRLRIINDNMREMVAYLNLDGTIAYANPAYKRALGYDPAEMVGKPAYLYTYAEDLPRVMSLFEQAVTEHLQGELVEFRCLHADGHPVWIEASGTLVFDDAGQVQGILAVFRDIGDRNEIKRLQQEEAHLQLALQKESELSELKSRMMIRIGHEFRTPLAVIQTSSQILERYLDRLSHAQRSARVKAIQQQIRNITDMLDAIGGVVRGSIIPQRLERTTLDLCGLCRELISEIIEQTAVPIVFQMQAAESVQIEGDYAMLRSALRNILGNAVKYSPPDLAISVQLIWQQDRMVLMVRDQGIGIPQDELYEVFEPFYRGSNVGDIRGLGLGLTVARAVIEAHHGALSLDSAVNQGTVVTIHLPL